MWRAWCDGSVLQRVLQRPAACAATAYMLASGLASAGFVRCMHAYKCLHVCTKQIYSCCIRTLKDGKQMGVPYWSTSSGSLAVASISLPSLAFFERGT